VDSVIAEIRGKVSALEINVGTLQVSVAHIEEKQDALTEAYARFSSELPNFRKMELAVNENHILLEHIHSKLDGTTLTKVVAWNTLKGVSKGLTWVAVITAAVVSGVQFLLNINHPIK
jgi:hypothetical protein